MEPPGDFSVDVCWQVFKDLLEVHCNYSLTTGGGWKEKEHQKLRRIFQLNNTKNGHYSAV